MNNLNTSNLKDIITSTLQEILAEDPTYFFPNQLKILTWKSKKIAGALITKVGQQRYLGLLRKDSQGQEYWKYRPLTGNSNPEPSGEEKPVIPDNIQHKTEPYGNTNHSEQSTINQQSS